MENSCGYNQNKDQLVADSKNRNKNTNIDKELEGEENRNKDHHPSE